MKGVKVMISDEFNKVLEDLDDVQCLADFRDKIQAMEDATGTLKDENEALKKDLKQAKAQIFLSASKKDEPEEEEKSAYDVFKEQFLENHGGDK